MDIHVRWDDPYTQQERVHVPTAGKDFDKTLTVWLTYSLLKRKVMEEQNSHVTIGLFSILTVVKQANQSTVHRTSSRA